MIFARDCRQLVCVGEWCAASLFFVRALDGDSFFPFLFFIAVGRMLLQTSQKGFRFFRRGQKLETRMHSLVIRNPFGT